MSNMKKAWLGNLVLIIGLFGTTFAIIYFTESYNRSHAVDSATASATVEMWTDEGSGASLSVPSASPDSVSGASASSSPSPDAGTGASLSNPAPDAGTGASAVTGSGEYDDYDDNDHEDREENDDD